MQKGRHGERYILGNKNLMLREVFEILSRLTGVKAPAIKLPRLAILPLAYAQPVARESDRPAARIPLEGVKMAKYKMHYDCSKAIRELGLPQTPPEVALEKAVRWFRDPWVCITGKCSRSAVVNSRVSNAFRVVSGTTRHRSQLSTQDSMDVTRSLLSRPSVFVPMSSSSSPHFCSPPSN